MGNLTTMKPFDIYLASPYSDTNQHIVNWRMEEVNKAAGWLMRQDYRVFSPLSMSHPIAVQCGLPTDWAYWQRFDKAVIPACERFAVLMLPGWQHSKGLIAEWKIAEENGLSIVLMTADGEGYTVCELTGLQEESHGVMQDKGIVK